jgi:hypothetical protein
VLLADTLYYLSPLDDATLERMALRVADLLAPGGVCVLVNHYFFASIPIARLATHPSGLRAVSPPPVGK